VEKLHEGEDTYQPGRDGEGQQVKTAQTKVVENVSKQQTAQTQTREL